MFFKEIHGRKFHFYDLIYDNSHQFYDVEGRERKRERLETVSFPGNDVGCCHKSGSRMLTQDGIVQTQSDQFVVNHSSIKS